MADTEPSTENRSLVGTLRWLLFGQYDNTTEDTLRQGFVFIGLATSFLSFVGATSAILRSSQLYWVTLALLVLGVATLVFTWMLVQDQLDLFGSSSPESGIVKEPDVDVPGGDDAAEDDSDDETSDADEETGTDV